MAVRDEKCYHRKSILLGMRCDWIRLSGTIYDLCLVSPITSPSRPQAELPLTQFPESCAIPWAPWISHSALKVKKEEMLIFLSLANFDLNRDFCCRGCPRVGDPSRLTGRRVDPFLPTSSGDIFKTGQVLRHFESSLGGVCSLWNNAKDWCYPGGDWQEPLSTFTMTNKLASPAYLHLPVPGI